MTGHDKFLPIEWLFAHAWSAEKERIPEILNPDDHYVSFIKSASFTLNFDSSCLKFMGPLVGHVSEGEQSDAYTSAFIALLTSHLPKCVCATS